MVLTRQKASTRYPNKRKSFHQFHNQLLTKPKQTSLKAPANPGRSHLEGCGMKTEHIAPLFRISSVIVKCVKVQNFEMRQKESFIDDHKYVRLVNEFRRRRRRWPYCKIKPLSPALLKLIVWREHRFCWQMLLLGNTTKIKAFKASQHEQLASFQREKKKIGSLFRQHFIFICKKTADESIT